MEKQYESHIAQGGTNISGGQKQRLAIARAIARNPEIYIFDDSFSALDYKTDITLRKELKKYTKNCSKLLNVKKINTIDKDNLVNLMALKVQALEEEKIYYKHFRRLCSDFGFTPSSLLKLFDASPSKPANVSIGAKLFG